MLEILEKAPECRNKQDLNLLFSSLKSISFFEKLLKDKSELCVFECLKYMTHESYKAESIVFEMGTRGQKFYIILEGKVSISIKIPSKTINTGINGILNKIQHNKTYNPKNNVFLTNQDDSIYDKYYLIKGQSFGELALLTGRPRNATIICEENCEFAVLEKRFFAKIMNSIQMNELQAKLSFLSGIPLLGALSPRQLSILVYFFKKQTLFKGNTLYKPGEEPKGIYIIISGEFKVFRLGSMEIQVEYKNFQLKKPEIKPRMYNVGIIGEKEVIGFEEIALDCLRKNMVQCISATAEVLFINKKEFVKNINIEAFQEMKNYIEKREKIREKFWLKSGQLAKNRLKDDNFANFINKGIRGTEKIEEIVNLE